MMVQTAIYCVAVCQTSSIDPMLVLDWNIMTFHNNTANGGL